jgi:hypothetical protein
VSSLESARVRDHWDTISDCLTDRDCVERCTGQDRRTETTLAFVHISQSSAEITRRNVLGLTLRIYILENHDPREIRAVLTASKSSSVSPTISKSAASGSVSHTRYDGGSVSLARGRLRPEPRFNSLRTPESSPSSLSWPSPQRLKARCVVLASGQISLVHRPSASGTTYRMRGPSKIPVSAPLSQ